MTKRRRTLLAMTCMSFACHAATTLAEGSKKLNSNLTNESSPTDDNWILSERSIQKDRHNEVRSNNGPLIESKAKLGYRTKQKDEDTFESFEQQAEPGIRTYHEETDETAPRIQQVGTSEQTNDRRDDYVAGAHGDTYEDETGSRQFEFSVKEVLETGKISVPEAGKVTTDHASATTDTVSELDSDKNGAEADRPSHDHDILNSIVVEQLLKSTETDSGLDDNNAPDTMSAEFESDNSSQEAFLAGNNLEYDHASTFHVDEESDVSIQRLEVRDTMNTDFPSVGPGHDEISNREADSMDDEGGTNLDLSSDDDKFNTETGPLLNEGVDVGSTADSVESTESTVDGKKEATNSMKHELYKTIGAMNATHESTLTHKSADKSEDIRASLVMESGTPEAALGESGNASTINTVNATYGSTLTNTSADESDKVTVSVDSQSATPENVTEESVPDSTHEQVPPATYGTASNKTLASADGDDDVIDFDELDAGHDPTLTNTSADESYEATPSLDTQSATPEDSAERSVTHSTHNKSLPAINETGSDENLTYDFVDDDAIDFDTVDSDTDVASTETQEHSPGSKVTSNPQELDVKISITQKHSEPVADKKTAERIAYIDLEGVASEQATESSDEDKSTESTAPKKGSLAEFFKKVSKGDEKLGKGAQTLPGASPSMKSANAHIVRRKEPVVETTIPLPVEVKKAPDHNEGSSDEVAKYTGAWGSRKHSTSSSSRVPDDDLRRLLRSIQETKHGEAKDTREAENDALSDENSGDDGESGDEIERKKASSVDIANGGEIAAETIDKKQRQATASDYAPGDNENPMKAQKSVNTEFVDGLDDIDKFLEEVDPPDELDVGAAGSSIQEVLIGQSVQIVIKRAKLGFNYVSKFMRQKVAEVKAKFDEFVSRRTNQDGDFALFTRQEVDAVAKKSIRIGRRILEGVQDLLNDMFGDALDEDLLSLDLDLDRIQAKIVSLRTKEAQPRSGNVASTKESIDADANVRQNAESSTPLAP